MRRTDFYEKVTVDNTEELDFLDNNLSKLKLTRAAPFYRLSVVDRKRPDLISYKNYKTVGYWWLVCVANGIQDPFFETGIGRVVRLPNLLDVYDFFRRYKKR